MDFNLFLWISIYGWTYPIWNELPLFDSDSFDIWQCEWMTSLMSWPHQIPQEPKIWGFVNLNDILLIFVHRKDFVDSIGIWIWLSAYCVVNCLPNFEVSGLGKPSKKSRGVLFEFHLKFWNTASIGIPARSLL